ncbi:hypothetical protein D3C75_810020 [compost metagenome]
MVFQNLHFVQRHDICGRDARINRDTKRLACASTGNDRLIKCLNHGFPHQFGQRLLKNGKCHDIGQQRLGNPAFQAKVSERDVCGQVQFLPVGYGGLRDPGCHRNEGGNRDLDATLNIDLPHPLVHLTIRRELANDLIQDCGGNHGGSVCGGCRCVRTFFQFQRSCDFPGSDIRHECLAVFQRCIRIIIRFCCPLLESIRGQHLGQSCAAAARSSCRNLSARFRQRRIASCNGVLRQSFDLLP